MNKSTKQLHFSKETQRSVLERDKGCIFCRMGYHMQPPGGSSLCYVILDVMHYVNRSAGGLGIEENGVTGCRYHHHLLDNGNKGLRPEMLEIMEKYLKSIYPDWDKEKLYYKKWEA